jgi:uncharacterized protein (TIGR03118 family)
MAQYKRQLFSTAFALSIVLSASSTRGQYAQTNIVSDIRGMAPNFDPNLNNPWGISFTPGSPFWVSDEASTRNGSQVTTLYGVNGTTGAFTPNALIVSIPNQNNAAPDPIGQSNGPTGQVTPGAAGITTNATMDFQVANANPNGTPATSQANFIFANLDGSISAWSGRVSGTQAAIEASVVGAAFSGLAIGNSLSTGAPQIYAADQNSPSIDVFNSKWQMTGSFTDHNLPASYTAFNIQNIGGNLYVTFANQSNALGGIVDEFNTDGTMIQRLVTDTAGAHLDQPWGLALAPTGFGPFGGDLLVGNNNGDGRINAYSPSNGTWLGSLMLQSGHPFSEADLWALTFGSGGGAGLANTLYFTAGLSSQTDGLIGSIASVPEPSSILLGLLSVAALGLWSFFGRRAHTLCHRLARSE